MSKELQRKLRNADAVAYKETIKELQDTVERLESDVKNNALYREECVLQLDTIEKLQAQLARCVVELKNAGCWLDSLNELPKIVHLDAEVLRCADEWAEIEGWVGEYADNERCNSESCTICNLGEAVRAKMEAIK